MLDRIQNGEKEENVFKIKAALLLSQRPVHSSHRNNVQSDQLHGLLRMQGSRHLSERKSTFHFYTLYLASITELSRTNLRRQHLPFVISLHWEWHVT